MDPCPGLIEDSFSLRYTENVTEALEELPYCFTITDPCISGHPIVFASKGFLKMVGYSKDEVIGRNGRIFQGPETDRRTVMEIREAIREERTIETSLLNYRKNGKPFWILFQMCPVFSKGDGRVINFVGVQVPILGKPRLLELGFPRDEMKLSEDRAVISESIFRCCRREICSSSILEQGRSLTIVSVSSSDCDDREIDISRPCPASEVEKAKASTAISTILSLLTHYSELTGRLICRKRCCSSANGQFASSLNLSLGRIKQSFVLTDALVPDMPIVYASEAFLRLTGYDRHEVVGRNCRFLSGIDTDYTIRCQIKESIKAKQACTVRILNYRKDTAPFWNLLHISPIRNSSGKVVFFVGVQVEDSCETPEPFELRPETRQLSVVGAVRVAVRGLSMRTNTS
uniref:Putative LOV domain-containing protein n=1 Tax=Pinguicula agnata TaxID=192262 RepID=A0A126WZL9_9LAMI|nr:putative LOV domain-containing protein [Pinguicula agnata]